MYKFQSDTSTYCPNPRDHTEGQEGQKMLRVSTDATLKALQQTTDVAAKYVSGVSAGNHASEDQSCYCKRKA